MSFNVISIKTKNDCDIILDFITDEQDELLYQKVNINHDTKASTDSVEQTEADLIQAASDLATADGILAGMAEGPAKELQITKQVRLTLRVRVLNERKKSGGVLSLFQKEYLLDTLAHQEQTLATWKTNVADHKATLAA